MIHQFRFQYPIELMCRALAVSRGGYYAWRRRGLSACAHHDAALQVRIAVSHRRSRGTYGSPRILADLRDEGIAIGRKRMARLLRAAGLRGVARRRFRLTTDSNHPFPIAPNRLNPRFAVAAPNQVWAADLTYLATAEGWLYLAVVLDLHSRRVVGWAVATRLDRGLVLVALNRALALRDRPQLHHSDRGCQYASADYRAALAARGITISMSRAGNCYDNPVVESFFATLKRELVERQPWSARDPLTSALAQYIDGWYNPVRRHSRLGYLSPVAFEHSRRQAA